MKRSDIEKKAANLEKEHPQEILKWALDKFDQEVVLASSLGAEDQVLTEMLLGVDSGARIFVLDTGRLHQETYDLLDKTRGKYGFDYEIYFPNTKEVERMLREEGANSFYKGVKNRRRCCDIRKVEPLNRALSSAKAWITGLRRQQAVTRTKLPIVEWDEDHNIVKINPLATWTEEQVWDYLKKNDIPYNPLHDQGYPSIGCEPCTRPVKPGEDIRAGRWWWENPDDKECGLHVKKSKD